MICGLEMIMLPTAGVRTSISIWKLPIVAPWAGSTFHNKLTLLTLFQSNATTIGADYSSLFHNMTRQQSGLLCERFKSLR